jgi:hypothetical protein
MSERSIEKFGAIAGMMFGATSLIALLTTGLVPQLAAACWAVAGAAGLGAIPGLSLPARSVDEGWYRFTMALAYVGCAVMLYTHSVGLLTYAPQGPHAPAMLLATGSIAAWVLMVSLFGMLARKMRSYLARVGMVGAVLNLLAVGAACWESQWGGGTTWRDCLLLSGSALTACWCVWLGVSVRRRSVL